MRRKYVWLKHAAATPVEQRAFIMAEAIMEGSGLRWQSGQQAGLALILRAFAEREISIANRDVASQETKI